MMMGRWRAVVLFMGVASVAHATLPDVGRQGFQESGLSASGGSVGGGLAVSAACATMPTGDVVCYDNNGAAGGQRTTDAAPQAIMIRPQAAFAGGTQTAANVLICGGQDETKVDIDDFNQGVAADSVTVTVIDSNGASTATALAWGTDWCVSGCTTNALTATSLATAIDALAGVAASATSAQVRISLESNTCAVTLAESKAALTTVATGTPGVVRVVGTGLLLPAGAVGSGGLEFFDDADGSGTGMYRVSANVAGLKANGVLKGGFSSNGIIVPTDTLVGFSSDATVTNIATAFIYDGSKGLRVASSNASSAAGQLGFTYYTSTRTSNRVLVAEDCGGYELSLTDTLVWTLPTTPPAGCRFTFVNTGAANTALITITSVTPNAIAGTTGAVTSNGTAANSWKNTKLTSQKNDFVEMVFDGTNWQLTSGRGVWAN